MDLPKKHSRRYVAGVYAFFIILFAFTLSLFYISTCQKSSSSAKQNADSPKPLESSDNLLKVTKKIDINEGPSENQLEPSESDGEFYDEDITGPLSKKDYLDEPKIDIDGFETPPGEIINRGAAPPPSQPPLKSSTQKVVIYFSPESTGLTDQALEKLRTIYLFLLKHPGEELAIEGYGDSSINNRHNKNLSKLRATIVEGYFVKRGISNSRIKTFWMGSEDPAGDNIFQEGRNKTHQVEVEFKSGSKDDLN